MSDERANAVDRGNVAAGIVAGLIGGLVGTFAMSEFQGLWSKTLDGDEKANELAARVVADATIDRELTPKELRYGAAAVHYVFGGTMGALYGGLSEVSPSVRALGGAGWGTAVWIGGDRIAVPLLGLSRPEGLPLDAQAQAFTAHIVFGVTVEAVRRGVRALLTPRA